MFIPQKRTATTEGSNRDGYHLHQRDSGVLRIMPCLPARLRPPIGVAMEILTGLIGILLFVYLLVAMLRPEKF